MYTSGLFEAPAGGPTRQIETTDAWEKAGGRIDSLESKGAHALIEDTDDVTKLNIDAAPRLVIALELRG